MRSAAAGFRHARSYAAGQFRWLLLSRFRGAMLDIFA